MSKKEEKELSAFIEFFKKNHKSKYTELFLKLPKENQMRIKALHESAFFVVSEIDKTVEELVSQESAVTIKELKEKIDNLNKTLQCLEFAMQWEWGFDRDAKWHTWWMKPKNCLCPRIDNSEMLGFGRIVTSECPIHGRSAIITT